MITSRPVTTIWCDAEGCLNSFEAERTIYETTRDSRKEGWTSGKQQLCPEHSRHALGGGDHAE